MNIIYRSLVSLMERTPHHLLPEIILVGTYFGIYKN